MSWGGEMNKRINEIFESITIVVFMIIVILSFIFSFISITEIKELKTQQKYYENEIIDLIEEINKLKFEKAENKDLEQRISELEDFIDNYEDLLGVYFNWLKDNPNGTQEEFELYLFTNHRWLYDWAVAR